jgi:uncharacterized protein (TIGR03545 family)
VIRWNRFFLLATPLVLLWAAGHFFLDRGLKIAVEQFGSAANGARVDVRGLTTRFWRLSLDVRGLAVADADAPMTNIVEIEAMRFKMAPKPLFWRRFIMEEAAITGVRTGTKRRVSGALPRRGSPAAEKTREIADAAVGNIKTAYDPSRRISTGSLTAYVYLEEKRARLTTLADQWRSRADSLDVKNLSVKTRDFIKKAQGDTYSGLEGVAKAQAHLKEAKDLRAELKAARNTVKELKNSLTSEIGQSRTVLKEIDRLRREDIQRLVGDVKGALSAEGALKGLLGPAWTAKLDKALGLFEKTRRLSGSPENAPPPEPKVAFPQGRNIDFPFHHRWPVFHLKHAVFSGETPDGLTYKGEIRDAASDPVLLGRPAVLTAAGSTDNRSLDVKGVFDFTTPTPKQSVLAKYAGLPLGGLPLGDLKGPVALGGGTGAVRANITVTGTALGGRVDLKGDGLSVRHELPADADRLTQSLHAVLGRVKEASIGVGLGGTLKSPRFSLNSTLDDQLRGAVKGALDQEVAKLRADAEKSVAALLDKETDKLAALVNERAGDALAKIGLGEKDLGGLDERLEKALRDLTGKTGVQALPDSIQKLFKKK